MAMSQDDAEVLSGIRARMDALGRLAPPPEPNQLAAAASRKPSTLPGLATVAGLLLLAGVIGWQFGFRVPAAGSAPAPSALPVDRSDLRFTACGGNQAAVIAAFPLAQASSYLEHLPLMGRAPELEQASPAFVVVFEGRWPGEFVGGPPDPDATPETLAPSHHDVCVWLGVPGAGTPNVYSNVDTSGLTP
jgi:hypothetical protein